MQHARHCLVYHIKRIYWSEIVKQPHTHICKAAGFHHFRPLCCVIRAVKLLTATVLSSLGDKWLAGLY